MFWTNDFYVKDNKKVYTVATEEGVTVAEFETIQPMIKLIEAHNKAVVKAINYNKTKMEV